MPADELHSSSTSLLGSCRTGQTLGADNGWPTRRASSLLIPRSRGIEIVRSLLDNGMSLQRVRRAWDYLRREGEMDDHLAEVKLVTDGQTIFHVGSDEGELMDALRRGQLAFFVAIDEITREVEEDVSRFELDRSRFLDMLRRVEDDISEERAAEG